MCASRLGRRWWPRWSAPPKPVRSPNTPHQHNPPRCFARAAVPTLSSGGDGPGAGGGVFVEAVKSLLAPRYHQSYEAVCGKEPVAPAGGAGGHVEL